MKRKTIVSLALAVLMALTLSVPALAAEMPADESVAEPATTAVRQTGLDPEVTRIVAIGIIATFLTVCAVVEFVQKRRARATDRSAAKVGVN